MKKLSAVVVGFGGRGATYAKYAMEHPQELEILAVADPNPTRRETAAQRHGIPEEKLYKPRFRTHCLTCGMRLSCNGCADCGKCRDPFAEVETGL